VNLIATQYIAASFQYQPALGAPILRAKSGGVYQPLAWIVWGWRYCTSQDERIRRPFFEGEMIVFAGSLLCVGVFFALAGRQARKLTENAEDLHGSARWADEDDVWNTGLLTTKHGVYVGGWRMGGSHRLSYLRHDGPEHILAFAPTRSGKGVGLVIPSLLAWARAR
jgi:type IV secretion system protein VirD4